MINVAFLMLDGAQLLDFAGPHDVFTAANQILAAKKRRQMYSIDVFSERVSIRATDEQNIQIGSTKLLQDTDHKFDTVVVVGGQNLIGPISSKAIEWLKHVSKRARRIISICTGAYLLAAAGLLDNRKATTHWMYCSDLQRRYPKVMVDRDSIWTKDGKIYTSAGVTAGIDLAIAVVEEDCGADIAVTVARGLVVYFRCPGSQSQFSQLLKIQHSKSSELKDLIPWILENLQKDLNVSKLAKKCAMSERHFARQFTENFSETPAKLITNLRLETAKNLLSESDLSIEQISKRCGFNSSDVFRKSFLRSYDLTPFEFRSLWRRI